MINTQKTGFTHKMLADGGRNQLWARSRANNIVICQNGDKKHHENPSCHSHCHGSGYYYDYGRSCDFVNFALPNEDND
jgi:hypothetical protein